MSKKIRLIYSILFFGLLWSVGILALEQESNELKLLSAESLSPDFQIVASQSSSFEKIEAGFLLNIEKEAYLIHSMENINNNLSGFLISLSADTEVELVIIADITTTGNYTYQFQKKIEQSEIFQDYRFSLRHPLFKNAKDFGIKFSSRKPAQIFLHEISFYEPSVAEAFVQIFQDYFQVAPYSSFTVNIFPTPQIFGHSAFVYFLPFFLVLFFILIILPKQRKKALLGLLILWLIIDFRMSYEFFNYQLSDYNRWIKPPQHEKQLRIYDDFYVFIDWLKENLPEQVSSINFYESSNAHFPRILQYYLYPVRVEQNNKQLSVDVIFRGPELVKDIPGTVIFYDEDSYILIKQ